MVGARVASVAGGLSVSLGSPLRLPAHRRAPAYGGSGRDPVFELDEDDLEEGLAVRVDPEDSTHAFIEPAEEMLLAHLQERLEATRPRWRRV